MQRRQRRLLMILAFSALAGVALFFLTRGQNPPVETDPLRMRAESAASLGEELASLARSQLESLSSSDRPVVERQIARLEDSAASVRDLLRKRERGDVLLPALSVLEGILDEILVPAKTEVPKEGSAVP